MEEDYFFSYIQKNNNWRRSRKVKITLALKVHIIMEDSEANVKLTSVSSGFGGLV